MKVITDYFTTPHMKTRSCIEENEEQSHITSGINADADGKYETRKIRIRLKDPKDPNSYFCEIYDTSPEMDSDDEELFLAKKRFSGKRKCSRRLIDDLSSDEELNPSKRGTKEETPKVSIKSYFLTEKSNTPKETVQVPKTYDTRSRSLSLTPSKVTVKEISPVKHEKPKKIIDSVPVPKLTAKETLEKPKRKTTEKSLKEHDISIESRRKSTRIKKILQDSTSENLKKPEESKVSSCKSTPVKTNDYLQVNENGTPKDIQKTTLLPKIDKQCEVVLIRTTLAPVFCRQKKEKVSLDASVVQRRQLFLQNGIERSKPKASLNPTINSMEPCSFTKTLHIQQRCDSPLWSLRPINLKLKEIDIYKEKPLTFRKLITKIINVQAKLPSNGNVVTSEVLKNLELFYKNLPIKDFYKRFSTIQKKFRKKGFDNEMPPWTVKYKPNSTGLLENEKTIQKLRDWFKSWKNLNFSKPVQRDRKISNSSSDAFVHSSDDETSESYPETACILHGPCSSGKTATIYAIAEEFDLNVLEINASSKRSGKKMLVDLQEATQSRNLSQQEYSNADSGSSVILIEEANIVFEEFDDGFSSGLQQLVASSKRPVILLTDDLRSKHLQKFRQYIGFDALLELDISRPSLNSACAILELITLVEGSSIPRAHLRSLIQNNRNDIRKSILELQFWIDGRGSSIVNQITSPMKILHENTWWESHSQLFKKRISLPPLPKIEKSHKYDDLFDLSESSDLDINVNKKPGSKEPSLPSGKSKENFNNIFDYFETVSFASCFNNQRTTEISGVEWGTVKMEDSLSLSEANIGSNFQADRLSLDISQSLADLMIRSTGETNYINKYPSVKENRWRKARIMAEKELLDVLPVELCTGKKLHVDYLPGLREICRAEVYKKSRQKDNKRVRTCRNSSYNYLTNFGSTQLTDFATSVNCSVFKN